MKTNWKKAVGVTSLLVMAVAFAFAAPDTTIGKQDKIPPFPGTLINARYVYVTSYDGNEFNPNILPEDREAISVVQNELQKWGRYVVVYRPREADMIIAVQSRGSEDILAVYDPHMRDTYLWRMTGREGLQKGEAPLMSDLKIAVNRATK
jgi:hypothetical protein